MPNTALGSCPFAVSAYTSHSARLSYIISCHKACQFFMYYHFYLLQLIQKEVEHTFSNELFYPSYIYRQHCRNRTTVYPTPHPNTRVFCGSIFVSQFSLVNFLARCLMPLNLCHHWVRLCMRIVRIALSFFPESQTSKTNYLQTLANRVE